MILTRSRLSLCCQCCHVLFCSVCFFLSGSDLSKNPPEEGDYQVGGNNVIACSDVHWSQCPFGRPCCIVDGASYLLVAWLSCDKGMLRDFLKDLGWRHIWYTLGDFSFSFWDSQNLTAGLNKSLSMLHFRVAADMPQMEWCIQRTQKKVKKRKEPIELASGCLFSQTLCSWIRLHSWGGVRSFHLTFVVALFFALIGINGTLALPGIPWDKHGEFAAQKYPTDPAVDLFSHHVAVQTIRDRESWWILYLYPKVPSC